jgi:hypothetical protein
VEPEEQALAAEELGTAAVEQALGIVVVVAYEVGSADL